MKPEKQYVSVFFDKAMLERIDEYRFTERFPSRTEAIRRLIEIGLSKSTPKPHKGKLKLMTRRALIALPVAIASAARMEKPMTLAELKHML